MKYTIQKIAKDRFRVMIGGFVIAVQSTYDAAEKAAKEYIHDNA